MNGIFNSSASNMPAVSATGTNGAVGVKASSDTSAAVEGNSDSNIGVIGSSPQGGIGVKGASLQGGSISPGIGVLASSDNGDAVNAHSRSGTAVNASSDSDYGVRGSGGDIGVYAHNFTDPSGNDAYLASGCCAGDFYGLVYIHDSVVVEQNLRVNASISKPGGKFQIDHPLDPANKYLSHSFVESPDMKNIYDGIVVLDDRGEAMVELPAWFEALNKDFRYQLTCIAGYAPVYIAQKIRDNSFTISGGKPAMEVSWQVTGIRQDAWANAYRIQVEEEKPAEEQGYYLHPELHSESEAKHVQLVRYPEMVQLMHQRKRVKEESEGTR